MLGAASSFCESLLKSEYGWLLALIVAAVVVALVVIMANMQTRLARAEAKAEAAVSGEVLTRTLQLHKRASLLRTRGACRRAIARGGTLAELDTQLTREIVLAERMEKGLPAGADVEDDEDDAADGGAAAAKRTDATAQSDDEREGARERDDPFTAPSLDPFAVLR